RRTGSSPTGSRDRSRQSGVEANWTRAHHRSDGGVTLIDGLLAVAVLAGLTLNAAAGLWWGDPVAAVAIVSYKRVLLAAVSVLALGVPAVAAADSCANVSRAGRGGSRGLPRGDWAGPDGGLGVVALRRLATPARDGKAWPPRKATPGKDG